MQDIKKITLNMAARALSIAEQRINDQKYHYRYILKAKKVLSFVEKQKGKLSDEIKKRAKDYAIEVYGDKKYAPWLHVYSAIRGDFIEGWIPSNYYGAVVLPAKNGIYRNLEIKNFTNRILNIDAIPDIAYLIDGKLYSRDYTEINMKLVADYLFRDSDQVVFKRSNSMQGIGVEILTKNQFDINKILSYKDGVFQSFIKQHDFFKDITENSTATIRITSVKNSSGGIDVRAAYLKVGRDFDNIVKVATTITIPLNSENGYLNELGYMPDYREVACHPDTGYVFSGKEIPFFQDCKDLCKSLHKSIPHLTCIGWDLCVDHNNKVKIFEWNTYHPGIHFNEATTGPCFLGLGWENLWKKKNEKY